MYIISKLEHTKVKCVIGVFTNFNKMKASVKKEFKNGNLTPCNINKLSQKEILTKIKDAKDYSELSRIFTFDIIIEQWDPNTMEIDI